MKKFLSLTLAVLLILTSGCADRADKNIDPQKVLEKYLENIEDFDVPVREFGEPTSYIDMAEGMVTGILYPETEYEFLNSSINEWVLEIAEYYKAEETENKDKEYLAELTIDYESFVASETLVSVKMKGVFSSPRLAHPIDVFKTFNANIKEGKMLAGKDIFTAEGIKIFEKQLAKAAGVEEKAIDDNITNYFVLHKDAIEIVLVRGDYLPMSDGTKTFSFKYEDIKELLSASFDLTPTSPEKEEPENVKKPVPEVEKDVPKETNGKKVVALTFDDGPSIHTERLLDIFAKNGGKGTFFVVGNLIDRRPDTIRRIVNEGHEIANHGWDHRQLTSLGSQDIKDQIMMTRAKIYDISGVDSTIVRPPYGSCDNSVKTVGRELGVSFVNWSVDTLDWKTKNSDSIYNEIIKCASSGSIILCHDLYKTTVDAMERVIPTLVAEGYELVTVSELLGANLEPGKMYYRQ
ncbi:MAG: polysaccharide deacetylase family protein [Clostridia bacterium]|nr:polysaccharide deacetylase family protein [Clostridia bacterium]